MKKDSGFFTFMGILLLVAIAVFVGARMLLLKNDVPQGVIVNSPYQAKIVTNKFGKAVTFSPDSVRFLGFYSGKVWGEIGQNIPFYKVTEVHKYHHYTLKYRVEEYDVTYQCSDCGYNTHRVDTKKNLLERIEGDTTTKEVPLHEKYVIPKNTSEDKIHTTYRLLNT